jgi:hypothetical protein
MTSPTATRSRSCARRSRAGGDRPRSRGGG